MWKLKSAGEIREFLSGEGRAVWLVLLMIVGVVFILIGNNPSDKSAEVQSEEGRIGEMCAMIEGVGECRVMMTYQGDTDEVYAVLILCEGAESVAVREKITSLFTSLYGIGSHRVEIQRLNK